MSTATRTKNLRLSYKYIFTFVRKVVPGDEGKEAFKVYTVVSRYTKLFKQFKTLTSY